MKIQIGKLFINKTSRYLVPCLAEYGKEYSAIINSLFKVGIGIGDVILKNKNIIYEKHIFILVDVKNTVNFKSILDYLRHHESYENDYAFDHVDKGCLHMIIVKIPQQCEKALNEFINSNYSKMYSVEEIQNYFSDKPNIKCILVKDNKYKINFAKQINEKYKTNITEIDIDEENWEFEFPLNKLEEFFQIHK